MDLVENVEVRNGDEMGFEAGDLSDDFSDETPDHGRISFKLPYDVFGKEGNVCAVFSRVLEKIRSFVSNLEAGTRFEVIRVLCNDYPLDSPSRYLEVVCKNEEMDLKVSFFIDTSSLYLLGYFHDEQANFFNDVDHMTLEYMSRYLTYKKCKIIGSFSFGSSYSSIGKSRSNLELSFYKLQEVIKGLGNNDTPNYASFMLMAIQMLCEASRFRGLERSIIGIPKDNWQLGGELEVAYPVQSYFLTSKDRQLQNNWADISEVIEKHYTHNSHVSEVLKQELFDKFNISNIGEVALIKITKNVKRSSLLPSSSKGSSKGKRIRPC